MTQRNFPMVPPVVAGSDNLTRMRLTIGTDSFLFIGGLCTTCRVPRKPLHCAVNQDPDKVPCICHGVKAVSFFKKGRFLGRLRATQRNRRAKAKVCFTQSDCPAERLISWIVRNRSKRVGVGWSHIMQRTFAGQQPRIRTRATAVGGLARQFTILTRRHAAHPLGVTPPPQSRSPVPAYRPLP